MKKITFSFLFLGFSLMLSAQVLNQSAAWPNTSWTITGVYNSNSNAFEADPRVTSNFAFDDNEAGLNSDDDIAAESPVIDLTAAFNAGQTWLFVDVEYTYNFFDDLLTLEYWDSDLNRWVLWEQFLKTNETPTNNFCNSGRQHFTSIQLNISGFSSSQLLGFRYRISFLDDGGVGGAALKWGFCFNAPTITSQTPPICPNPSMLSAHNITETSVDLSWTENGVATTWDIEWGLAGFVQGTGTRISTTTISAYSLSGLTQGTSYDFYIQSKCGSENSKLTGPFTFTTALQSNFTIDCNVGGLTIDYCYGNKGETNPFIYTFTSSDNIPLRLVFNRGFVENGYDELVVLDSDGIPFLGYGPGPPGFGNGNFGNAGNISGLSFISTGNTISYYINSDDRRSCQSDALEAINFTVSCATCVNPKATYTLIDDCSKGDQFLIDVDITSFGDATSLIISNSIDANTVTVMETGVYEIGPFPLLEDVIVTVSSVDDVNCVIKSQPLQLLACPPQNDDCEGALTVIANANDLCEEVTSGTILSATPSDVTDTNCEGYTNDDVWFKFVAQDVVEFITIKNIKGGTANLDHRLYEGTCGNLTQLYCSKENSSITPELTIGKTYYIRVFSGENNNETSTFDLCIREVPENTICENAENFCFFEGKLVGSNTISTPNENEIACLGSMPNPSWNVIQIGESGLVEVEIIQWEDDNNNGLQDGGEKGLDVDFVLWGPFNSVADACGNIDFVVCPTCPNNTINTDFYPFNNIVDCSYSAEAIENLTIDNAVIGEIYMLLVTNFSNAAGRISVEQTNAGNPSAATIIGDVEVEIISKDVVFEDTGVDVEDFDVYEASVCGLNSVTIATKSILADHFSWFKNGTLIPGETGALISITESGSYQVQAYDDNCGHQANSQIVVVNIYNHPEAIEPQMLPLCDGLENDGKEVFDLDSFTTSLALGDDFTVRYYKSTIEANQAINAVVSPYESSGETLIMRVEDTDAANNAYLACNVLSQVELVVNPIPTIGEPNNLEACSSSGTAVFNLTDNDTIVLNGLDSANYNVTYHTSLLNANANLEPITSPYPSPSDTIYVRIEEVAPQGCYNIAAFELIVLDEALAYIDTNVFYYDEDTEDFLLCAETKTPIQLTIVPQNFTLSDVTIQWQRDGIAISGENRASIDVEVSGEYSAIVTYNSTGCEFILEDITVIEFENCLIPRGISPGVSLGLNDTFDLSYYKVTKLEIFNRNGTRVYSKTNYTNQWRGQTNDGQELPVGTYFYTMIYEEGTKKRTGWVYINK